MPGLPSTSQTEISPTASTPDPEIVLVTVGEEAWLVKGEAHLDVLLAGTTGYPLPVGCIRFATRPALQRELGPDVTVADLWLINPAIIERLRTDQHLLEITAPA